MHNLTESANQEIQIDNNADEDYLEPTHHYYEITNKLPSKQTDTETGYSDVINNNIPEQNEGYMELNIPKQLNASKGHDLSNREDKAPYQALNNKNRGDSVKEKPGHFYVNHCIAEK